MSEDLFTTERLYLSAMLSNSCPIRFVFAVFVMVPLQMKTSSQKYPILRSKRMSFSRSSFLSERLNEAIMID